MSPTRRMATTATSLVGTVLLGLAALPAGLPAQTVETPAAPEVFVACYGSLTGVVYRIEKPGILANCLHRSHVRFSWTNGAGGGVSDHGGLSGLGDDDHPQYLRTDGSRALAGPLSAGGHRLTSLGEATAAGDAVRFEQAVKGGDAAGGDLGGTYPNPAVAKLQGIEVSSTAPANGQVLTFDGPNSRWTPATPSAPASPGATGQTATSTYGTREIGLTSITAAFTEIPGLTQTIVVPPNSVAIISTGGGVYANDEGGVSVVDIALFIDGIGWPSGEGGLRRVHAVNTDLVFGDVSSWSLQVVRALNPGTHTIDVRARLIAGTAPAKVSGNSDGVLQGDLTVVILRL